MFYGCFHFPCCVYTARTVLLVLPRKTSFVYLKTQLLLFQNAYTCTYFLFIMKHSNIYVIVQYIITFCIQILYIPYLINKSHLIGSIRLCEEKNCCINSNDVDPYGLQCGSGSILIRIQEVFHNAGAWGFGFTSRGKNLGLLS